MSVSDLLCESFVTAQSVVPRGGAIFSLPSTVFYGFILILQPVCDSWSHGVSGLNKAQRPFAKPLRNVLSLMKCVSSTVNRAFMELNESEL